MHKFSNLFRFILLFFSNYSGDTVLEHGCVLVWFVVFLIISNIFNWFFIFYVNFLLIQFFAKKFIYSLQWRIISNHFIRCQVGDITYLLIFIFITAVVCCIAIILRLKSSLFKVFIFHKYIIKFTSVICWRICTRWWRKATTRWWVYLFYDTWIFQFLVYPIF